MGKFVWKDNIIVDFGDGVTFEVQNDIDAVRKNMLDVNTRLQKKIDQNPNDDTAAVNAMLDAIDEVLGDGATGHIFAGHALSPRNVMAAYLFITDEILTQLTGYEDLLDELKQASGKLNALSLPTVNAEALAAANEKLAELGITPPASMPSAAEAAIRPRL